MWDDINPVGQLLNSDPLGPSGMPFLDEVYQSLAVGPVDQPFITGPLDNRVSEPDCRRTNRIQWPRGLDRCTVSGKSDRK